MEHYGSDGHEHEGLQAVPMSEQPEVVPHQRRHYDGSSGPYSQYTNNKPLPADGKDRTICGLRTVTLVLVILLALAVVAICVVGGFLGTKKTTRFVKPSQISHHLAPYQHTNVLLQQCSYLPISNLLRHLSISNIFRHSIVNESQRFHRTNRRHSTPQLSRRKPNDSDEPKPGKRCHILIHNHMWSRLFRRKHLPHMGVQPRHVCASLR